MGSQPKHLFKLISAEKDCSFLERISNYQRIRCYSNGQNSGMFLFNSSSARVCEKWQRTEYGFGFPMKYRKLCVRFKNFIDDSADCSKKINKCRSRPSYWTTTVGLTSFAGQIIHPMLFHSDGKYFNRGQINFPSLSLSINYSSGGTAQCWFRVVSMKYGKMSDKFLGYLILSTKIRWIASDTCNAESEKLQSEGGHCDASSNACSIHSHSFFVFHFQYFLISREAN